MLVCKCLEGNRLEVDMAIYTAKQSILDEALGAFKDYGFTLTEANTRLELCYKEKLIGDLNPATATFENIRDGCKNYLANINRS